MFKKIFGPKREEVRGEWRRLHIEELHDQIKVNDTVGACGTYWRQKTCRVLGGNPEGKNHLEDLVVDGRITLRWIFK